MLLLRNIHFWVWRSILGGYNFASEILTKLKNGKFNSHSCYSAYFRDIIKLIHSAFLKSQSVRTLSGRCVTLKSENVTSNPSPSGHAEAE